MQKYKVRRKLRHSDGIEYDFGSIIELDSADAKRLNAINALEIFIDDGEPVAPKPKPKAKRKKPAQPMPLDDGALLAPDPKVR